jgi:hypothetical protein
MEMIVDKLARLTPEQQREVEDFIDFLITRDSNIPIKTFSHENEGNYSGITDNVAQPTPMIFADERSVVSHVDQDILPDYPEYGGSGSICKTREPERRIVVPRRVEKEPGKLVDWID